MIFGIGTDVVVISRLERILARPYGRRFLERVYTEGERRACGDGPQRNRRLAARFAAKEAALKALGTGLSAGISWREIEVTADRRGKPELVLHGRAAALAREWQVGRLHLSLSHDGPVAVAFVVAERVP